MLIIFLKRKYLFLILLIYLVCLQQEIIVNLLERKIFMTKYFKHQDLRTTNYYIIQRIWFTIICIIVCQMLKKQCLNYAFRLSVWITRLNHARDLNYALPPPKRNYEIIYTFRVAFSVTLHLCSCVIIPQIGQRLGS